MRALIRAFPLVSLALFGCRCGPPSGSSDASFDAIPCDMRTPEESATGINYSDTAALWPGTRFVSLPVTGGGIPLPNGDLLAYGEPAEQFVVRLSPTGTITRELRRPRLSSFSTEGGAPLAFFMSDSPPRRDLTVPQTAEVGILRLGTEEVVASTSLLIDTTCEGVATWSPVLSAGRYLSIRPACVSARGRGFIAERWQAAGTNIVRSVGPIEMPQPGDRNLIGNRTMTADGEGGLRYLAVIPNETRTLFTTHAVHWDGTDTPPTLSAPLGDPPEEGRYPEGAFGERMASGDYLMAINAVSAGFTRTWVARVRPDMSFAWTWTSPRGFVSGPQWIAADVVGDQTRILLYQPASGQRVYVQGLDANGQERWPEPLLIRTLPGDPLHQTRLAAHLDGSFTAYSSARSSGPEITLFDPDGIALSTHRGAGGSDFGHAMYADNDSGVWFVSLSYIQHYDRSGWPLYRRFSYDSCGERPGIVARTGPDAEPMTYFYDNGWPPGSN